MSGIIRPQWSQLAEPLWADPGLKSEIGVRELNSTLNKIFLKSAGGLLGRSNILPKLPRATKKKKKKATTTHVNELLFIDQWDGKVYTCPSPPPSTPLPHHPLTYCITVEAESP